MALNRYQAGTAWIRVTPDFRDFGKKLERQVQDNLNSVAARAKVDTKSIDRARAEMRALSKETVTPGIEPKVNKKALAQAERLLDGLDAKRRTAVVTAEVNKIKAEQELSRLTKRQRVVIEADVDGKSVTKNFDKIRTEISKRMAKEGPLTDAGAKAISQALRRALKTDVASAALLPHKREWDAATREAKRLQGIINSGRVIDPREIEKASDAIVKAARERTKAEKDYADAQRAAVKHTRELEDTSAKLTSHERAQAHWATKRAKANKVAEQASKQIAKAPEAEAEQLARIDRLRKARERADEKVANHPATATWENRNKTQQLEIDRQARAVARLAKAEDDLRIMREDVAVAEARRNRSTDSVKTYDRRLRAAEAIIEQEKGLVKRARTMANQAEDAMETAAVKRERAQDKYAQALANHEEARLGAIAKAENELASVRAAHTEAINREAAASARYNQLLPQQTHEARRLADSLKRLRSQSLSTRDEVETALNRANTSLGRDRAKVDLRVDGRETDTAHNRLLERMPSHIADSRIEKDVVARQAAMKSAAAYDRTMSQLEQRTYAVRNAERALADATRQRIALEEAGQITSERGVAALEREAIAIERVTHVQRQQKVSREQADRARGSYNLASRGLEDRINLNPIQRFLDKLDHGANQVIGKINERLIFAGRLLSAVSSLGMAAAAGLAGLGAINLVPLVGSISQVVGVLGLVPAMAASAATAIAAIAVGANGIGDAFKAAAKLTDAKAKPATGGGATRGAQRTLENAQKSQARTAVQGARQIRDAEKSVTKAQKSSEDAQKDLTRARAEARDEIEDMNRSLKGLALDEEDAALSVQEARKNLRETMADPDADAIDRKRANLSYRQAIQNLDDVRRANQDTRNEVAEANRKGVEGSDKVVSAQERATAAQEGLVEAQQNLVETQQDVAQANADAADRIADAQEALAAAAAGGASAVDTAAAEFEASMERLAPNAQALVVGLLGVGDAWTEVRKRVGQNLFRGIADDVFRLANVGLPVLDKGLSNTAAGLNRGGQHILNYLASAKGLSDLDSIFTNTATSAGSFSVAISNGLQALISMAEVGTRFMPWFGQSVEDTTRRWRALADAQQANGGMEAYFARSIVRAQQLGSILGDIGGIIATTFQATSTMGLTSLTHLSMSLEQFREKLNTDAGQDGIREFFTNVREMLHAAGDLASSVWTVISNDVIPALQMVNDIMSPIIRLIAGISAGISDWAPLLRTALSAYLAFRIVKGTFGLIGTALTKVGVNISTQTGLVGALTRAWTGATTAMNGYAARAIGLNTASAAIATTTARTGALAGAMGKVSTGARNLFSFVGGPAGIAVGALVVGLTAWYGANQKLDESTKRLTENAKLAKKAQENLHDAIEGGRGKSTPEMLAATQEHVEAIVQQWQILSEAKPGKFDLFGGMVAEIATLGKSDLFNKQLDAKLDEESVRKYVDVMNDLKLTTEDIALALSGTDEQWAAFKTRLDGAGESGAAFARQMELQRYEIQQQREAIAQLEPGYLDLQASLGILADTASSTADKFDALSQAFKALIPGNEEREAVAKFGKALEDIQSKINSVRPDGGFGAELLRPDGDLDLTKGNAIVLDQAIQDGRDTIGQMQIQGADQAQIDDAWAQWTQQVETLGAAMGITGGQLDTLLEKLRATPDQVTTLVAVQGIDKAGQDLVALRAKFSDLAPGETRTIKVRLNDENSKQVIRDLGGEIEELGNGQVAVTIDEATFNDGFDRTVAKIQALNLIKSTATVDLDTGQLRLEAGQAANIVNLLDQYKADPVARLLIDQLQANSAVAITSLDSIERTEPNPVVDANIQPLKDKVAEAKRDLDGLATPWDMLTAIHAPMPDGSRPTPEVMEQRQREWAQKHGQAPTGPAPESGVPGVLQPGDFAKPRKPGNYRGGRIPGFSIGGMLPTSGPGTQTRDGIYAVGPDGLPRAMVNGGEWVINPAMSQKYSALLALINADKLTGFANGGTLPGGKPKQGAGIQLGPVGDPFAAMVQGVGQLGSMFTSALDGEAIPAWTQFAAQLQAGATSFINPALTGVSTMVTALGQKFPEVGGLITPAWQTMSDAILAAKTTTIDPVFSGIQGGLTTVEGAFTNGVNNIRTQWAGIQEATAAPVRFTIGTVFNDGLVGMWNSVADLIGATKMNPYVAKFATGGVLPGYTPGRDVHEFYSPSLGELHLSGGEAIMRPEWTRAMGGPAAVDKMNQDARAGKLKPIHGDPAVYRNGGVFGRFASGGTIANGSEITSPIQRVMWDAVRTAFPNVVLSSGTRYADVGSGFDNHMGQRALDLTGPMPEIARWIYQLNKVQPVEELIHAPLNGWQNLKAGQPLNYGAGTDADHLDHVHWAMASMRSFAGKLVSMAMGNGPLSQAAVISPEEMVRNTLAPMKDELATKVAGGKFPGQIGTLPAKVAESMTKSIEAKAIQLAKEMGLYNGPAIAGGGNVERWRPMVIAALKKQGFEPSKRNQDLMLSQIGSESGGDPNAINLWDSNAQAGYPSQGILQTIPSTFEANRDPSIPGGITDPWANMNAALRYYRGKYGPDLGAQWGQGHGYDRGGIFEDGTFGFNTSGKPEAVFTNKQFLMLDKLVESLLNPKMFARLTGETPVAANGAKVAPKATEVDPEYIALGENPEAVSPEVAEMYKKYGTPVPGTKKKDDPKATDPAAPADPATPATPPAVPTPADPNAPVDPKTGNPPLPTDPKATAPTTPPSTTNPQIPGADPTKPTVPEEPVDPLDSYNGPFSDILKKGRLIGQAAQGLASPDGLARIGDIDHDYKKAKAAKQRLAVATKYRTDAEGLVSRLRAEGKEKEAAEVEAGIAAKERELAGGDPQKIAELASLADGEPASETFRLQAEESFKQYLAENAIGISESVVSAGIGAAGNSGAGDIIINGGIRTNSWNDAQRKIERTRKRQSRQSARAGFR
ncbi:tail length tape measure protein [Gordonia phage Daredevil]|uniref:Tape measure protein n=1 Tax=Gordonia phage Daredevil TaxID=2283286 RepID=A0A345MIN4_9CAUD|nr:tail length tape measure protein [Gordonia phage Daredevil]AXH70415.1 tape measure protein [Gordonia phage Daredevil]